VVLLSRTSTLSADSRNVAAALVTCWDPWRRVRSPRPRVSQRIRPRR
jgi:hypothetical protein